VNNNVKLALVGAGSFVAGAFVGFVISNAKAQVTIKKGLDKIEAKYVEELEEVSTSFQDLLDRQNKTGNYATVKDAAEILLPVEEQEFSFGEDEIEDSPEDGFDESSDTEEATSVVDSVEVDPNTQALDPHEIIRRFNNRQVTDPDPEPDEIADDEYDDEPISSTPDFVFKRDPNGPYVISIDMFMEEYDDSPYQKVELTWFDGDEILVDSRNQIVPNVADLIGTNNLNRWGDGTTDPSMVYIRNERQGIDIELTRDDQTYSRAILGIPSDEEVRRSMVKPLKMREGDDN
jgi:hypothetical protein